MRKRCLGYSGGQAEPSNLLELRQETVRKVPEVSETRANKAPKPSRWARFGPEHRPNPCFEAFSNPFSDSFNAKFAEFAFYALG
jgi:hypothetical protein